MSSKLKRRAKAQEIRGTSPSTVLSKLFRKMLLYVAGTVSVNETNIDNIPVENGTFMDEYVSHGRYDQLMTNYVTDPRNCIPNNKKEQSSARGNLQKELLKSGMSWKVFIKGARFLDILKIDIQITAHHRDGKHTVYKEHINIGRNTTLPDVVSKPRHSGKGYFQPVFKVTPDLQENVNRAISIRDTNKNIQ